MNSQLIDNTHHLRVFSVLSFHCRHTYKTRADQGKRMEEKQLSGAHRILIVGRKNGTVSGVSDVQSFDENEIVMDSSGISLSSAKDIRLKAKGAITMDATSKISATAKQDVSLEGLNVKVQAKVGATVKGNATAELSASGQTTVKGAMVMIN